MGSPSSRPYRHPNTKTKIISDYRLAKFHLDERNNTQIKTKNIFKQCALTRPNCRLLFLDQESWRPRKDWRYIRNCVPTTQRKDHSSRSKIRIHFAGNLRNYCHSPWRTDWVGRLLMTTSYQALCWYALFLIIPPPTLVGLVSQVA